MNPADIKVSVIIPTYNRAELLREALTSVFQQTHRHLEIIVVDDGSTENIGVVLAEFGQQIRAIRLERSGISLARNAAIDVATGDYVAFLDSDDLWEPEKIQKQLTFFSTRPGIVLSYTDATQFSNLGPETKSFAEIFPSLTEPQNLFTSMITEYAIPLTSTVMIQTAFLKNKELRFPPHIKIGEDLGLFLTMLIAGATFGYLPEKLTRRRMHDSNISSNHCGRFEQRKLLYTGLLAQTDLPPSATQKSVLKRGLRAARYYVGECFWEQRDFANAKTEFWHAIAPNAKGVRALAYGLLLLLPTDAVAAIRNRKS